MRAFLGMRPDGESPFATRTEHGGTLGINNPQPGTAVLPPAATAKLARLRDDAENDGAALRDIAERKSVLTQERNRLAIRIQQLTGQRYAEEAIAAENAALARVNAEVATLDARTKALNTRRPRILRRLEDYVRAISSRAVIEPHPAIEPKLAKGTLPLAAVEAIRDELKRLDDALDGVRSAPVHSEAMKAAIRAEIGELAERGCPDVLRSIELGASLRWPQTPSPMHKIMGHAVGPGGALPIAAFVESTPTEDLKAVLAWALSEVLIAKLEAEVDELSEDANALTNEERAEQVADILATMLETERTEEALIELAESQGTTIPRRAEADPRAVLGLSSDLPAPR